MRTFTTIILLAMMALVSCKKDEPVTPAETRCIISDTCYVKLEDLINDKLPCDSCKNLKIVDLDDYFPNPDFDFNQ
jgi:hypothetical protein